MRRDHFELDVDGVDWVDNGDDPEQPRVTIAFDGSADQLRDRLDADEGLLEAGETDVAFRLQESHEDNPDATGVIGITNRITGEFVLELNSRAGDVLRFVQAAREYGERADGESSFGVNIAVDDETLVTYEKDTFLVYDADGNLLRTESLIPSGVEL